MEFPFSCRIHEDLDIVLQCDGPLAYMTGTCMTGIRMKMYTTEQ